RRGSPEQEGIGTRDGAHGQRERPNPGGFPYLSTSSSGVDQDRRGQLLLELPECEFELLQDVLPDLIQRGDLHVTLFSEVVEGYRPSIVRPGHPRKKRADEFFRPMTDRSGE